MKTVDKPTARAGKRNAPAEAPAAKAPAANEGRGGRRDGANGNEGGQYKSYSYICTRRPAGYVSIVILPSLADVPYP